MDADERDGEKRATDGGSETKDKTDRKIEDEKIKDKKKKESGKEK